MLSRNDLPDIVVDALKSLNGHGTIVQICKYIWDNYEHELRKSGDLFYCWQYDIRWAGQRLRDAGVLISAQEAPRGYVRY